MEFTYRNPERSTDASATVRGARSLVVAAKRYRALAGAGAPGPSHGRVAAYARSDHYGDLRDGLQRIAERLTLDGHRALVVADDNALVDREAAVRAGLGWYGKASNVLLPGAGSWFVLGSVITTAELDPAVPLADGCGPCRRCLDGCPTEAIVAPGVVDAARCLSWLLQKKGPFPRQFRSSLGDRIYGCDDCQEVCPPNRRQPAEPLGPTAAGDGDGWLSVLDLLESDDANLLAVCDRWYVPDRDPVWLRRNALVVLGNTGDAHDQRVVAVLTEAMAHPNPVLRAQALWSARQLGLTRLEAALADDEDPVVVDEWTSGQADGQL
jgi:epoxyqueuosine reductase